MLTLLSPNGVQVSPERDPKPVSPRLPRDIYVHYVRPAATSHNQGMCQLRAESIGDSRRRRLKAGTPYTLRGVMGCSPAHSHTFDLRCQIDLDGWETHIVSGRDLLP